MLELQIEKFANILLKRTKEPGQPFISKQIIIFCVNMYLLLFFFVQIVFFILSALSCYCCWKFHVLTASELPLFFSLFCVVFVFFSAIFFSFSTFVVSILTDIDDDYNSFENLDCTSECVYLLLCEKKANSLHLEYSHRNEI